MKKLVVLALAALMAAGPAIPAAAATEPFARQTESLEADFGRRPPPRPAPRRAPPRPAPRRDRGRDHRRDSGGSFAGALIGSAIAGLIAGAIADNDEPDVYYVQPAPPVVVQPAPPVIVEPAQPVLVCDQYGNCWYEY